MKSLLRGTKDKPNVLDEHVLKQKTVDRIGNCTMVLFLCFVVVNCGRPYWAPFE